MSILARDL